MLNHSLLTALVTPFTSDNTIDFPTLGRIIDSVLEQGSDGLVMLGTTAESVTLDVDERWMLYHYIMKYVHGRVPVYAGIGTNNTQETLRYSKMAEEAKVNGLMIVTPYYNRPQQKGLYCHFKEIADQTNLPVMIYSVPSRCGVAIEADTIIRLANDCPNIIAYKYANSDLSEIGRILDSTKENFVIYSGEDGMLLEGLRSGMNGIVSVIAHIYGTDMKKIILAYKEGEELVELDTLVKKRAKVLFCESSPVPIKYALHEMGYGEANVRLPLVELSEEHKNLVKTMLCHK